MKNNNKDNKEKDRKSKIVTIFNFECNNCRTKIGQLVSNNIDEEMIACPKCGSTNISYGTLLK